MAKTRVIRQRKKPALQRSIAIWAPEFLDAVGITAQRKMKRLAPFYVGDKEHGRLPVVGKGERGQLQDSIILERLEDRIRISTSDPGALYIEFVIKAFFRPGVRAGGTRAKSLLKRLIKTHKEKRLTKEKIV